jgi:hypothetical protein
MQDIVKWALSAVATTRREAEMLAAIVYPLLFFYFVARGFRGAAGERRVVCDARRPSFPSVVGTAGPGRDGCESNIRGRAGRDGCILAGAKGAAGSDPPSGAESADRKTSVGT